MLTLFTHWKMNEREIEKEKKLRVRMRAGLMVERPTDHSNKHNKTLQNCDLQWHVLMTARSRKLPLL